MLHFVVSPTAQVGSAVGKALTPGSQKQQLPDFLLVCLLCRYTTDEGFPWHADTGMQIGTTSSVQLLRVRRLLKIKEPVYRS